MFVLNSEQMRAADAHAIEVLKIPSLTLMEHAATRVAEILVSRNPQSRKTVIVCGKGNNGGDGMATARLLQLNSGWNPVVVLLGAASDLKADPAENWKRAKGAGVNCTEISSATDLDRYLSSADLIVDALFGTGLIKPLEGIYSEAVQRINRAGKEILSIDVPSGLSSDTGELIGPAIKAAATVALAAAKYCHILAPACKMCGEVYVVDIGIPVQSTTTVILQEEMRRVLPHRKADSHKGSFGHAVIVAGSRGKSGAAYMSGKAALRCGAGLSTVVSPSNVQPIVASYGPEIMTETAPGNPDHFTEEAAESVASFVSDKNAVAIGPGIGTDAATLSFFQRLLPRIQSALLIDADGLNLLAKDPGLIKQRKPLSTILTPHPGEMARLMQTNTAAVQKDRIQIAKKLAAETQSIVVLKGYRSIIADPTGNVRINLTGGQPLASAGTGDVLTGIITGFIAQGLMPLDAATAGVYLHGFVANLFEANFPQQALNAMDILEHWNRAVHLARTQDNLEDEYLKLHIK